MYLMEWVCSRVIKLVQQTLFRLVAANSTPRINELEVIYFFFMFRHARV